MLEDVHAGSGQFLILSRVYRKVCTKEKTLQNTAQHGTARHRTAQHAGHGTARHRTALRRAVELAELNGAGDTAVCFFVLSASRSWV